MTRPTDDQVNILARHLGDLPQLAAESVTGDVAGTLVSVRGAAGSRLPPGVDLAALDLHRPNAWTNAQHVAGLTPDPAGVRDASTTDERTTP